MEDVDTLYARWLSGEISPEEEQALKESGEWKELEALIKAVDELKLPAYNVQEGYARLRLRQNKTTKSGAANPFVWLGVLAAAACIAFLLYFSWNSLISTSEFSADLAENTRGTLPDGSGFILNDGSSLQFQDRNWESRRVLTLKGEALFDVNSGNTFQVQTANGTVEVLGTQFNVRVRAGILAVECYEGKVSVSNGKENTSIEMGQSIKFENGRFGSIQSIDHKEPYWTQGSSNFTDESLNEVFEELARQYSLEIVKPTITGRFSGSFTHSNMALALDQVCKPMGLSFSLSEDKQIVTILE